MIRKRKMYIYLYRKLNVRLKGGNTNEKSHVTQFIFIFQFDCSHSHNCTKQHTGITIVCIASTLNCAFTYAKLSGDSRRYVRSFSVQKTVTQMHLNWSYLQALLALLPILTLPLHRQHIYYITNTQIYIFETIGEIHK